MVICADTSFLVSLYGNDVHTPRALAWCVQHNHVICMSLLNRFELTQALQFAVFRNLLNASDAAQHLQQFQNAIFEGRLVETVLNLAVVLAEATRLSTTHTATEGHRGFDILHVAAARIMGASHFLTFDSNQQKLAESEGLVVPL